MGNVEAIAIPKSGAGGNDSQKPERELIGEDHLIGSPFVEGCSQPKGDPRKWGIDTQPHSLPMLQSS